MLNFRLSLVICIAALGCSSANEAAKPVLEGSAKSTAAADPSPPPNNNSAPEVILPPGEAAAAKTAAGNATGPASANAPPSPASGSAPAAAPAAATPAPTNLSQAAIMAFVKAHALIYQKEDKTEELYQLLRGVMDDIPRLEVSTEPGQAIWNHREFKAMFTRFAAFRFSSPLDQPADLYWIISTNYPTIHWSIMPAKGRMQGFRKSEKVSFPSFTGPSFPLHDAALFQSLTGGPIEPGQDYIVFFAVPGSSQSTGFDEPLSIALRLLPAATTPARDDVAGIADRVGAPLYQSPQGAILLENDKAVNKAAVTPDGKLIAVCDSSPTIRLLDIETKEVRGELVGDQDYFRAVISSDGKRLAASAWSLTVSLWDLPSGKRLDDVTFQVTKKVVAQLAKLTGWQETKFYGISFPAGSSSLLAQFYVNTATKGMHWHEVVLWDLPKKKEVHRISFGEAHSDGLLTPDGRQLLITRARKIVPPPEKQEGVDEVAILDWKTDKVVDTISLLPGNKIGRLTLSPDGKMAALGGLLGMHQVLDIKGRAITSSIPTRVEGQRLTQMDVHAIAWSPDSRTLALAFCDNSIHLWDVSQSRVTNVLRGHFAQIFSLDFTPDSKRLVSAGNDRTIRIWTLDSPGRDILTDALGIRLVPLAAADFVMGTHAAPANSEPESLEHERPQHRVRLSRAFYMGQNEVTVKQYRSFVEEAKYKTTAEANGRGGSHLVDASIGWVNKPEYTWRNPGFAQADDHPVVQVSYDDAQAFCRWLSKREGAVYRLPTEAEWEYAACAGQEGGTYNARTVGRNLEMQDMYGNVADLSLKRLLGNVMTTNYDDGFPWTAPVGKFNLNSFGLYDMYGNVFEWCSDWYDPGYYRVSAAADPQGPTSGTDRVQRGGGCSHPWNASRPTRRDYGPPDQTMSNLGFRVVREIGASDR